MPKYSVDMTEWLDRYATVVVEAEDEEDAWDMACEAVSAADFKGWYEKVRNNDYSVELVKDQA